MPAKLKIGRGTKFERLLVLSEASRGSSRRFNLVCDCGNTTTASMSNLRNGVTQSCGCIRKERAIQLGHERRTHGESTRRTAEYNSWRVMKERCLSPNKSSYPRYGGRGIRVCGAWVGNFDVFLNDMGRKPSPSHTLDRIDNNGNYEPGNCRWATPKEQANNRRPRMSLAKQMEA